MLRLPLTTVYAKTITSTTSANYDFQLPFADVDGLVVKYALTTVTATAPTVDIYIQTSDDGGTTFFDMAHFNSTAVVAATAATWAVIPCTNAATFVSGSTATDSGSTIQTVTGLPVLGIRNRVKATIGGSSYTTFAAAVTIYANTASDRY